MWSIVAEPSLHLYLSYYSCTSNTFISIIFQKRPLKRDKTSFVLRKLSWEPILDRYCTTVIPILLISNIFLTKSWASSHLSTVGGWFVQFDSTTTNYNNSKDNTSAEESLLLSSNFRAFQIVSDILILDSILRCSQEGLLNKFKPLNVGLRESKMTL